MANEEHLKILQSGLEAWNKWRDDSLMIATDLSNADLRGAALSTADLSWANLSEANLRKARLLGANLIEAGLTRANLNWADLSWANLSRANLSEAELFKANLSGAHLRGAYLRHAQLRFANLTKADLSGAELAAATLLETVFADTDLSGAKGLESCVHLGPSVIDHRTLQKSGPLPKEFLRGCGLPDNLIEQLPTLLAKPTFYSCFISYSSDDQEFAERLYADLQDNGVRCWFAPHDIKGGQKLHEQIDRAIASHDRLLLILSEHSMNSEWVKTEIAGAREREAKESKQLLFPIGLVDYERIKDWECFDADRGKDSAREIREYYIPDFQNWEDDQAYTESFERLMQDLKAAAP